MIYVVGLGPGEAAGRTLAAQRALEAADALVGYSTYLSLIRAEFPHKRLVETPMRGERARCEEALRLSRAGQTVALVCSGDCNVYGMGSLLLELSIEGDEIELVPGVTAALSAAAALGAPISGDFAVISLSDLLTPWAAIENRLRCAARGDFVLALYNPASHGRSGHLRRACEILLEILPGETACGWARNVGRAGFSARVLTLSQLKDERVDMFTTALVGCRATQPWRGLLLTPRGYRL